MNVHYLFALCGMSLLLSCKGVTKQKNVPFSEEYPFRGVCYYIANGTHSI